MKANQIEQEAEWKEKLLRAQGDYANPRGLKEQEAINNMYLSAIEAKLAMLKNL